MVLKSSYIYVMLLLRLMKFHGFEISKHIHCKDNMGDVSSFYNGGSLATCTENYTMTSCGAKVEGFGGDAMMGSVIDENPEQCVEYANYNYGNGYGNGFGQGQVVRAYARW